MDLSIIIVNYNSKANTDTCIRKILHYPIQGSYEIIVVDNYSTDGSMPYLKERWENKDEVRFIDNPSNLGFGQACNKAIQSSQSQYIGILNPDIEVREHTITILLRYLNDHPEAGIVGPQLLYEDGTVQDSYRTFPNIFDIIIKRTVLKKIPTLQRRMKRYLMWEKNKNTCEPVDWLVGAFWVMRRSAIEKTGLFDPRFFLFFEDVDMCRRVRQAGYEIVYNPESRATHHHERLSAGGVKEVFSKKMIRIHIASALKYFWKWAWKKKT
jgi:GT2 family glycosyltransferase